MDGCQQEFFRPAIPASDHDRRPRCSLSAGARLCRAASRRHDRPDARLFSHLHDRWPLAPPGGVVDRLDRRVLCRADVAIRAPRRRSGLAGPRRALQQAARASAARSQRTRSGLHFSQHVPALVRVDRGPAFARRADSGRTHAGDAVSRKGAVSAIVCRSRFAVHRHHDERAADFLCGTRNGGRGIAAGGKRALSHDSRHAGPPRRFYRTRGHLRLADRRVPPPGDAPGAAPTAIGRGDWHGRCTAMLRSMR